MQIDGIEYGPVAVEPWEETLNGLIDNGEAWLDENVPGWVMRVNPDVLAISSSTMCITGQVFNQMWQEEHGVQWEDRSCGWDYWNSEYGLDGEMLGFDLPNVYSDGVLVENDLYRVSNTQQINSNAGWSYLTEEWIRRIEKKIANI